MFRDTALARHPMRIAVIGVLGLAAILFFVRLGDRALWTMELRWAEIPREMALRHDYFWPTINGRSYYDKPLGSYWLVVAAKWLTGCLDETAVRLPSAAAGLLGVLLLMVLARQLYDGRTAALAGFVLATSFGFVFFARTASTDMENVTGELAALVLFLHCERRPRCRWVVGLWLIMALTSLTKGLLGFALPLLVLGVWSCLSDGRAELLRGVGQGPIVARLRWLRGRLHWFFNRWTVVGSLLAAAVYLLPFAVSWARTGSTEGLYLVYRENVQRFFHAHNHRGPVHLYTYVIFGLMAPWSVLLPAALVRVHSALPAETSRRGDRFTRVYFWATFAFFTLSSSRRSYYLMPLLPAGALLVARLLAAPQELSLAARRLLRLGFGVTVVGVVLAGAALLPPARFLPEPWGRLPSAPAWPILAACWLGALAAVLAALRQFNRGRVTVAIGSSAVLFLAYLFLVALPATEAYRGERALTGEARHRLDADATGLALYRTREPVFYLALAEPVPEYDDRESLAEAVSDGRVSWVLARRRDLEAADLPTAIVEGEPTFAWETTEQIGNKLVLARFPAFTFRGTQ